MGQGSCGNAGAFSVVCAAEIKKRRKCPGMSGFAGLNTCQSCDIVILSECKRSINDAYQKKDEMS